MTEAKRTRTALDDVQRRWPTAVIYKFNDRSTKGIPDALVSHEGRSIWLEFKDAEGDESVESLMATKRGKLQLYELRRLKRAGASCCIVVFRRNRTCFYNVQFDEMFVGTLADFLDGAR